MWLVDWASLSCARGAASSHVSELPAVVKQSIQELRDTASTILGSTRHESSTSKTTHREYSSRSVLAAGLDGGARQQSSRACRLEMTMPASTCPSCTDTRRCTPERQAYCSSKLHRQGALIGVRQQQATDPNLDWPTTQHDLPQDDRAAA